MDENDIAEGLPFLIAPDGQYDIDLNRYFLSVNLSQAPPDTWDAVARDLARFLQFLWASRPPLRVIGVSGKAAVRPRTWLGATA